MRIERAAAALLLLAASACREEPPPSVAPGRIARARGDAARSLLALVPDHALAREVFQRQPDGSAGLAVLGTGFAPGDVIRWDGRPLPTTCGHSRLLTASVPVELLARPGPVAISIENASDPSRPTLRATFRLLPRPPPPERLYQD